MAKRLPNKELTTITELMSQPSPTSDALAKLLIAKGLISRDEFMEQLAIEREAYQKVFNPTPQISVETIAYSFLALNIAAGVWLVYGMIVAEYRRRRARRK